MISVPEAKQLILEHLFSLKTQSISLTMANGHCLAQDITSPISHPLFDQSAVDGYAFTFADLGETRQLTMIGEVKAGDPGEFSVGRGQASRIFTGAPLPAGVDTVVMQEFVTVNGNQITIGDPGLKPTGNVRPAGEQIQTGDRALSKGDRLESASIGFLASLGIREVNCFLPPKVRIIVTGSEFAESKDDLARGKIFESNGIMMQSALQEMGLQAEASICVDDLPSLTQMVKEAEANHEVILLTGGVSVGDYDFTLPALKANGFETIFHKVWQKPGKPLLFSRKGEKAAFGLPGNPRSVLACFYEYVYPYLRALQGMKKPFLPSIHLPLREGFTKKPGRAEFLTAAFVENGVSLRAIQGSHMLQSFAGADALVYLPADPHKIEPGAPVEVHLLPR